MSHQNSILIVDDSATTRAMIKRIFQMTDLPIAKLYEATDGQVALQVLQQQGPGAVDLVLTDINMPNMDGMQLTRSMRESQTWRLVPVVIITARPDDELTEHLKHGMVQGWLRKPFTPENVREVILHALSTPMNTGGAHA